MVLVRDVSDVRESGREDVRRIQYGNQSDIIQMYMYIGLQSSSAKGSHKKRLIIDGPGPPLTDDYRA